MKNFNQLREEAKAQRYAAVLRLGSSQSAILSVGATGTPTETSLRLSAKASHMKLGSGS